MKTNKRGTIIGDFVAIRTTSDMPSDKSPNWSRLTVDDPTWNEMGPQGERGIDGVGGRDGIDGTPGAAGAGFEWAGIWSTKRTYRPMQTVYHKGSSWVCTKDCQAREPAASSKYWDRMARKGAKGAAGADGISQRGPRGLPGTTTTVVVGSGEPMEAIFDSAAAGGMAVFVSSDGHVDLARANTFATSIPVGLAIAAVSSGGAGQYLTGGPITLEDWTLATGSEFLEPGKIYFLSVDDAGQLVLTTSEVTGTYVVIMGTALTQTTFNIEIHRALVNG